MRVSSILCGVGFDEASPLAFATALQLARESGAALTLLHACPLPVMGLSPMGRMSDLGVLTAMQAAAQAMLSDRAAEARAQGVPARRWVQLGSPADQLVELARHEGQELIVLGRRAHRHALARLVSGSISRRVLAQAPCPVLIVPATEPPAAAIAA